MLKLILIVIAVYVLLSTILRVMEWREYHRRSFPSRDE